MRVVLEVKSGAAAGRRTLLGVGQTLKVGRTEWADFSVPQDGHMSGVHFALETDGQTCYLSDLGSSNGTFVNDQPISEKTVLHHGDTILAGQTLFIIRTEGDKPEEAAIGAEAHAAPAMTAVSTPAPSSPPQGKAAYTTETCDSGLTLCRGSIEEIQPADLAGLLGRECPLFLIVDFKHLGTDPPEDLERPDYLFDWLSPEAAALVSPIVLSHKETAAWPILVEKGWGEDAVVCLFSNQEKPVLLEHLRRSARAKHHRDDDSGGMLGYCWPSVMALLLSHNTASFVEQLLSGIDAVLVELPDLPETWQLYGDHRVPKLLDRVGLVRKPPVEVALQQPNTPE